jgi:hypothetical protein
MIDIMAWIVIAAGIAGAATTAIGLHVPGRGREHPRHEGREHPHREGREHPHREGREHPHREGREHPHREGREHPHRDEYRTGWYWIGLSFLLVFSALAMLARNSHNKPLTWAAISAAGTIAGANATLWTIGRIQARR